MKDCFNREIHYLRISVTDLCNLRCRYCMPEPGVCKKSHADMLTEDEMVQAVQAAAALGIDKVRITGGEPLVKKNILSICSRISGIEGIREVCLTTNGLLLPEFAALLRQAGVSRLNISLDTLNPEKYAFITRGGSLEQALSGIQAALNAGFEKIKLNAVLIGGFNEDEIVPLAELTKKLPVDMRFIEMMPMYDSGDFDSASFIPVSRVLDVLPQLQPETIDGVARCGRLPGAQGSVGVISPITAHFCHACNRIRLTADGKIKPCLHSAAEYSIKGLDADAMRKQFQAAIQAKPRQHALMDAVNRSRAGRNMNEIGG